MVMQHTSSYMYSETRGSMGARERERVAGCFNCLWLDPDVSWAVLQPLLWNVLMVTLEIVHW